MSKYFFSYSIADRVNSRDIDSVRRFLSEHSGGDFDVTYNEGILLRLAIEGKDQSSQIVQLLLDYYEEQQLPKLEVGSEDYNILKFRLREAIAFAVEDEVLSDEMKKVLAPYIKLDDTDSRAGDFEGDVVEMTRDTTPSVEEVGGLGLTGTLLLQKCGTDGALHTEDWVSELIGHWPDTSGSDF